mmetsp:Transcript_52297/g.126451  ORF Transcript_52297/g.126451 Transcript_52297/m.126451 type:complete len:215 (+) Transcript_52297:2357-3001(+)
MTASTSIAFISDSSISCSDTEPTPSNHPMKKSGYRLVKLQITVRSAKLSKFDSVTPSNFVNSAPISVPTVPAPLFILMRVANNTASTPGGHSLAARTKVGRNAISPKIDRITSSPATNHVSGIPRSRLACVIRSKLSIPSGADMMDDHNKISLIGFVFRYWLYSQTPNNDESAVTSRTRPKNSGPKPKSSVKKYKNAPSLVGVDCQRNRNKAGL